MESLEQSEKRTEAAEKVSRGHRDKRKLRLILSKEVLVLRDREAILRRQLMEHWSGVLAWEVRRLERVSAETQARFNRQFHNRAVNKDREEELARRVEALDGELARRVGRVEELEEMVVEMGRRERAMEEEVRGLDGAKAELERERERWAGEARSLKRDKDGWGEERAKFEREREGWAKEKRTLLEDKEAMGRDRQKIMETGRMSDRDRATMDRVRGGLGSMLGKRGGVGEAEVVDAVEEVRSLLERRENEVVNLKEEMREINMGLEEEIRRISLDRDGWRSKVEKGERGRRDEIAGFERRSRVSACR